MPADHDSAATMSRRGGGRPERGGLGDRGAGAPPPAATRRRSRPPLPGPLRRRAPRTPAPTNTPTNHHNHGGPATAIRKPNRRRNGRFTRKLIPGAMLL